MGKIKFSIITCTWNSEPYIEKSINSVLSQVDADIEYIFVDGGSSDGTLERILSLTIPYKLLKDIRGGISNAMNEGLRVATGDVIVHLHGDDYFYNSEVLKNVQLKFEEEEKDWLFGKIASDVDNILYYQKWKMPNFSYRRLLRGNFIPHPAVFIKRTLFEMAGDFDVSLKYAMDYDLWLRLAAINEPIFVDECLACFRRHAGGASTANAEMAFKEDYQVRKRYISRSLPSIIEHWIRYQARRIKRI